MRPQTLIVEQVFGCASRLEPQFASGTTDTLLELSAHPALSWTFHQLIIQLLRCLCRIARISALQHELA